MKGPSVSLVAPVSRETTVTGGATQGPWLNWRQRLHWDWVSTALTVILLGGATARLVGGGWGLPLDLHPDEWVIVRGAIDMAQRRSFEPPYYFRPDHVEMQFSNLAYLVYSHLLHSSRPETLYKANQAPFILISRAITACFGVAMIVVAYLIGTRFTRAIGVLSAFVVAFFPPFVDHSHFATPDVPLSFAFMIVILGCMRYLDWPSWGNLLLASLGVSIAIAIKYPGALGAIMIAITVVVGGVRARAWSRILVHGVGAVTAVLGFLFVISPVLFTNFQAVASNLTAQAGPTHLGADALGWFGNLRFYAEALANHAGIILLLSFALGVFWSIRLRLLQSVPLWMGAVVWVILSGVPLHWDRWGLPMYLTPLLIAPIGAYHSFRYLLERGAERWLLWGAVGMGIVAAANFVTGSAAVCAQFLATNTQTLARDLAARGIDHTNTIYEGYTPLFPGEPKAIFNAFQVIGGHLVLSSQFHNKSRLRYVALSSDMYDRYKAEPKYAAEQKFYAMLDKQFPVLTTYHPVSTKPPVGLTWPAPPGWGLEIVDIRNALVYVGEVAHGGFSGPTIKVYEIPTNRN